MLCGTRRRQMCARPRSSPSRNWKERPFSTHCASSKAISSKRQKNWEWAKPPSTARSGSTTWKISGSECEEAMILLVTTCERGEECASVVQKATGEQVQVIKSTRQIPSREGATEQFQGRITVVVMDEGMLDGESISAQQFPDAMWTAIRVFINFA